MAQPQNMVDRVMDAAVELSNAIAAYNKARAEYDALGGAGAQLVTDFFGTFTESKYRGVTATAFGDGVAGMGEVAATWNIQKTPICMLRG